MPSPSPYLPVSVTAVPLEGVVPGAVVVDVTTSEDAGTAGATQGTRHKGVGKNGSSRGQELTGLWHMRRSQQYAVLVIGEHEYQVGGTRGAGRLGHLQQYRGHQHSTAG